MSSMSALPASIVSWLSERSELSDVTFLTEYPPIKKAIPLKRVIVAVGLEDVKIEDSFEENDQGVLTENEYCRIATLKIQLAIHVPFSQGGARCHEVFSNIIDCLTFASDLNIEESGCSAITADRDTDALVLNGFMLIKADFCPAETSDVTFASFLQKELLCGSHINDSRVHASTDEKYRWNNPFAIGNYFGDGSSHNSITLTFKPRAVIVFAADMPFTERESSSSPNLWLYAGIAAAGYGTYGVKITNNGFRADNVSTPAEGYFTVPRLNEAGQVYLYIAFR